jgi:hypothetical protein
MIEHISFSQKIEEISLEDLVKLELQGSRLKQSGLPVILGKDDIYFLHVLHLSKGAGPGRNGLQEADFCYYAEEFQRKGIPIDKNGKLPPYYMVGEEEQENNPVVFYKIKNSRNKK